MADVPKTVVSSAQAIPLVLAEEAVQDDRELVRLSQNGAVQPFEELVRRHQHRVLSVVLRILHRREDAEEITQQVFLKAYTSIRRFDMRSAFSTWLYKIAVNECWDSLRKKKVRPLVYESELSADQVNQLDTYARADRSTSSPDERTLARDLLERLLDCLSEEDRGILLMKEVEGLSVQEIAAIYDLNVNTVKVRMFRARATMMENYRKRLKGTRAHARNKGTRT